MIKYIFTHDGKAHLDELLACALLLSKYQQNNPVIIRDRNFKENEIYRNVDKSRVIVVDVGDKYDGKIFFDHHQDKKIPSSFVLILKHFFNFDLYKNPNNFLFPELVYIDYRDRYGIAAFREMQISLTSEYEIIMNHITNNPIVGYYLKRFSKYNVIDALNPNPSYDSIYYDLINLGNYLIEDIRKIVDEYKAFDERVKYVVLEVRNRIYKVLIYESPVKTKTTVNLIYFIAYARMKDIVPDIVVMPAKETGYPRFKLLNSRLYEKFKFKLFLNAKNVRGSIPLKDEMTIYDNSYFDIEKIREVIEWSTTLAT